MIPIFGTIFFIILYIIATFYYPGGSQVDKNSLGFSWGDNYWCNLLNEHAINGQDNPAKPIAIAGMLVLCISHSIFWFLFPNQFDITESRKRLIQISGVIAMAIAFFLSTNRYHDIITNLASIFGLIATICAMHVLYITKWYILFGFGIVNILLVGFNNYFYYNEDLIIYLPMIQGISFAAFLIWICCINIKLYRMPALIH